MYDINHKTIFVLDHTQYFSISSEDYIDLDFLKGKTTSDVSLPQFAKSLWTCSVEASVEYCRIVWDLFPKGKLIRFIVSDTAAHIVNTWGLSTQNMSHVLNAMAMVGVPQRNTPQSSDFSVIHGLRAAIEALAEPTLHQKELQIEMGESNKVPNKGRVICITSARDNPSMKSLEDIFHTVLMQQNTLAATQNKFLHIDHCHLVIINVVPLNMESLVTNRALRDISPALSTELHSTNAPLISNKLNHLILSHYDLASTTVTGIPMKEEQNANSSANYDVEILHAKNAHTIICGSEALLPTSVKEGSEYNTVTLKWCTPRGFGASDMQPCLAMHRVTPVDVTSRPSSCLINFLLNGRSVLLEMPRKTGGKLTSHLLSARGGEIFIHALQITRSCLEDLPSISEGAGGRVTDYRVSDFGAFIRAHRLFPMKVIPEHPPDENLERARNKMYRRSRYFPLTLSTTIAYNVRYLEYLLKKITKDELDENDVLQCKQTIYNVLGSASRGEALALPNMGNRLKGTKKDDQYKLLWSELEVLIQNSADTPQHKAILQCLQECRSKGIESSAKSDSESSRDAPKNIIRATTDSPLSPPHGMEGNFLSKAKRNLASNGHRSLLDIFVSAEKSQNQKRLDFSGRMCTPAGQVAKLYPDLGVKEATIKDEPTAK